MVFIRPKQHIMPHEDPKTDSHARIPPSEHTLGLSPSDCRDGLMLAPSWWCTSSSVVESSSVLDVDGFLGFIKLKSL